MTRGRVHELSEEMRVVRQDVGDLLDELQTRWREGTDVRQQARRHPRTTALVAAVAVTALTLLLVRRVRRRRQLRDPVARRRRLRAALARMAEDPDRVHVDGRGALRQLATATGTAFLAALARRLATETALSGRRVHTATPERTRPL